MDKEQENQQEENILDEREENLKKLKNVKNKNFFTSLKHSVEGIIKAFKTERNLRIDYFIAVTVLLAGVVLGLNKTEFVCLALTIGFVIFSEMMNSVAEYIVDLVTDKYDDRAKAAKDIAAGGVLVSSSIAVVVAYFLFIDKLKGATTSFIGAVTASNTNIFFTIMFMLVVLILILKGLFGRGEDYSKSGPSMRVALAFGLTTYVWIITRNLLVGVVCGILSFIIFGMKIANSRARTINIILSALLGILIVLIVYQIVLYGPNILQLFNI